ncbi:MULTISPECIES: tetratricopeptide repeat protein [Rhodomicrobium]|uniref:tetratricopeptide repeat protein n=1 Tax=Rhodomicrobium TaxID=1068 RepID=UPI000B4AA12D|nr:MULTISPECIES: tetratricopeptide repeat protein [Rhodomicrobium]
MKTFRLRQNASMLALAGLLAVFANGRPVGAVESDTPSDESYQLEDSDSLLGSYLAGRLARSIRDNEAAAQYYKDALEKDPHSKEILEEAFQLKVATGKFNEARDLARELVDREDEHKVASFFLGIEAFAKKDYGTADKLFQAGGTGPIADLTANLARAWIALARDQSKAAMKLTGGTGATQTEGSQHIELLHRAMIADLAGQRKTAASAYKKLHEKTPRNVRVSVAYARHAAYWGDKALAKKILEPHMSTSSPNPLVQSLADEIDAGKKPALNVASPAEGLADVFQGIGEALAGDGVVDAGQIYLQLALYAKPDYTVAHYALGELYDQMKNYSAAADSFHMVPRSSPLWLNAQLRKAYDLNSLEKIDEAKTLLKELVAAYPADMRAYYTLGNLLRGNKEYPEAVTFYTQAIERLGASDKSHWSVYYARGVCYERMKDWPKAEADLKKALDIDANQELTLNYLGYSWVDQNLNVKEAMELIRRAVQKRPNDGYFVDSLGWAYYRQADFQQAVKQLERAVELKPDDPVINDHLGDAYWKVGRRLEAQFQWKQSLDLKPEPEDEKKIRKKLESGLIEDPNTRASLENSETPPAPQPK